jgi:hypothetical protein
MDSGLTNWACRTYKFKHVHLSSQQEKSNYILLTGFVYKKHSGEVKEEK